MKALQRCSQPASGQTAVSQQLPTAPHNQQQQQQQQILQKQMQHDSSGRLFKQRARM
jgi:hypothetical protein